MNVRTQVITGVLFFLFWLAGCTMGQTNMSGPVSPSSTATLIPCITLTSTVAPGTALTPTLSITATAALSGTPAITTTTPLTGTPAATIRPNSSKRRNS